MKKIYSIIATTIVASAISSSISFAGVNSMQSFSHGESSVNLKSGMQQKLVTKETTLGMKSQYDIALGAATFVWAANDQIKPDLTAVPKTQHATIATDFYLQSLTGLSSQKSHFNKAIISSFHDLNRGVMVAKYKQEVQGVEVFNREYNVMIDRELNLVAGSGYFANVESNLSTLSLLNKFGTAEAAIQRAVTDLSNNSLQAEFSESKLVNDYQSFKVLSSIGNKVIIGTPRARKVFFEDKRELKAAYYVELQISDKLSLNSESFGYVIEGLTGKILFKNDLTAEAENFNYRVYADTGGTPLEGPHGDVIPADSPDQIDETEILDASLISLSHHASISTQDPWLSDDATTTSGNNVSSFADVVPPQGFTEGDFTAEISAPNTFDYPIVTSEKTNSLANRKAAIVNLFYMNNYLHDFFYDHGFDEVSGNAQNNNYERGGLGNDALEVQAQDSAGLNNANMATPADGSPPRMQMFLFNSKDARVGVNFGITVISPEIGVLVSSRVSGFGAAQFSLNSTEIVRIDDGVGVITDGCETSVNAGELIGKIAIIDRGACAFTTKVLNAQIAGAIGAIVVNNVDDGTPAPMGGVNAAVTLPNMGLNFADGAAIYDALEVGLVSGSMKNDFLLKDGTFDNGIVAHEWGHYISNRLVGNANGLNNNQGRSMGEGWGDFHALMFIAKASDSAISGNDSFQKPYQPVTFVSGFYAGIRRVPYTTNMDINPLSFAHIEAGVTLPNGLDSTNNTEVHNSGEIWASMLWDSYVSLINYHGFDEAQSRMADYLIAGYKMTPISPTFTEARDGILAAAVGSDIEDFRLILSAFARRGMGLGAVSPNRFDNAQTGIVESTLTELSTFEAASTLSATFDGIELGYCTNDDILDIGETGLVNITVTNKGDKTLAGVLAQLVVTSGHDVTFENDGLVTFESIEPFQSASLDVQVTLNDAAIADTLSIEVTFPEQVAEDDIVEADTNMISIVVNVDFKRGELISQQDLSNMEDIALFDNWRQNVMAGGAGANGTQTFDNGPNIPFFESFGVDLGDQSMVLNNNGFQSDVAVETLPFTVGFSGDFKIEFWHFYGIENAFDGGVVEVRINDGSWQDVTAVGGIFDVGYTGTLFISNVQALGDRQTFTGRNISALGEFGNQEAIRFGNLLDGQQVQFRFRISTDSTAFDLGWWIDNVQLSGIDSKAFSEIITGERVISACENVAPVVSVGDDFSIQEDGTGQLVASATDRNPADIITYNWVQTSGPVALISDADQATVTFTPPAVINNVSLVFEVTASDGTATSKDSIKVRVLNKNPPPDAPAASSGSGSMGFLMLLLLFSTVRTRKK